MTHHCACRGCLQPQSYFLTYHIVWQGFEESWLPMTTVAEQRSSTSPDLSKAALPFIFHSEGSYFVAAILRSAQSVTVRCAVSSLPWPFSIFFTETRVNFHSVFRPNPLLTLRRAAPVCDNDMLRGPSRKSGPAISDRDNRSGSEAPPHDNREHTRARASSDSSSDTASAARPDVLLIVVDSISRANFLRYLPRTAALIRRYHDHDDDLGSQSNESKSHSRARGALPSRTAAGIRTGRDAHESRAHAHARTHSAFMFNRFNVVGDNSASNMAAFFSGRSWAELYEIRLSQQLERAPFWLWDVLREEGYITAFAEEYCGTLAGILFIM